MYLFETIESIRKKYLNDNISEEETISKLIEIGEASDEESAIDIISNWNESSMNEEYFDDDDDDCYDESDFENDDEDYSEYD